VAGSGVSLLSAPEWRLQAVLSALRAGVLSFASPKESSQRLLLAQLKGDPRVGAGYAGPLRYSAGRAAAELGAAPLKQSSPKAPGLPALLSASQGDPKGVRVRTAARELECYGRAKKKPKFEIPQPGHGWFSGPLGRRRATQVLAGKGRGLSEARRAEFRSPRQLRVAQGTGVAGADPGSPFLWLLSFGEAKESTPAPQARKTQLQQTHCNKAPKTQVQKKHQKPQAG
jgi:hypothetical protein